MVLTHLVLFRFFAGAGGSTPPAPDEGPPLGGKGDNERRRNIVKPLGLLDRPTLKARPAVEDRVEDARAIQAEVAARLAREFGDETGSLLARQREIDIELLSEQQVAYEIGVLLRKKLRTEEDELLLLLLLAATA